MSASRTQMIRHAQAVHRHRRPYDDRAPNTVHKLDLDAAERRYCRGQKLLFGCIIVLYLFAAFQVWRGLP